MKRTPIEKWIEEIAHHCCPSHVIFCQGSSEEYENLAQSMVESGELLKLNPDTYPSCYLYRSHPQDVARTEHLTFVCTKNPQDAGPNNRWMSPEEGHERGRRLLKGAMSGRKLYVVPYAMGPWGSPLQRFGIQLTDSPYVVLNLHIMTRMGSKVLEILEKGQSWVKGIHSLGTLKMEDRLILHFPEESLIKSMGSGYGGNALLPKKCHALRLASWQGLQEGWMAEHMLLMKLETPEGRSHYVAGAFPSACGKTNLAMLVLPEPYKSAGWKLSTLGDDITWLWPHLGQLHGINPEAGFFGVAPGTSQRTNPNALSMIRSRTIFTNVALTEAQEPWWPGLEPQNFLWDWQGRPHRGEGKDAAHPNGRFTVSLSQCPTYPSDDSSTQGVPLSAIIFGGRRPHGVPLVMESKDWNTGVLLGASMASETTAAAMGEVGLVRRDPMAMGPFCGYNFGDYWHHWIRMGQRLKNPPKIFHVNWFRQDSEGRFLWPGFGQNMRVLEWIIRRVENQGSGIPCPWGWIPGSLNSENLQMDPSLWKTLLEFDKVFWLKEMAQIQEELSKYGDRVPRFFQEKLEEMAGHCLKKDV